MTIIRKKWSGRVIMEVLQEYNRDFLKHIWSFKREFVLTFGYGLIKFKTDELWKKENQVTSTMCIPKK